MAFILAFLLLTGYPYVVYGAEKELEIKKEYRTFDKEDDGRSQFKNTIKKDGIVYQLSSVMVDQVVIIDPGDKLTYESPPFVGDPDNYALDKTVEKEGKKYNLLSSELLDSLTEETTEYSESSILYQGVEYIDHVPEDANVKITNEDLNEEITVRLPAVSFTEENTYWDYNFTFPITVTGYQEDTYLLGDMEISNGTPFIDYAEAFLTYLNLPSEYYEITKIEWVGEPQERNGDMIRTAKAHGRKLVKDIRGIYGGEVTFPSVQAKRYRGTYVEERSDNKTDQIIYKKEIRAVYEPLGKKGFRKILKWILTTAIALIVFVLLFVLIVMLKKINKKRKTDHKKTDLQSLVDEE